MLWALLERLPDVLEPERSAIMEEDHSTGAAEVLERVVAESVERCNITAVRLGERG